MGSFTVNSQIFRELFFILFIFPWFTYLFFVNSVAVDQTTSQVIQGPMSGIMGLAFQAIANTHATPFWQALTNNNQLQSPEMSFALATLQTQNNPPQAAPGGTFTLGGTNSSLYTGDIEFLNLAASTPSFWLLSISCSFLSKDQKKIACRPDSCPCCSPVTWW
jgi:hypothetical protein